MKKRTFSTQTITMVAMLTAVLSVLSIIEIPMPSGVPVTLQTFAVALCGYVLGHRKGTLSIALYLFLGFLGVPVFTGMAGGIDKLFGFTGGFLYGFLFLAFFCGIGIRFHNKIPTILSGIAGLLICHIFGAFHYSIIAELEFVPAFLLVSVPYLIKDILSVIGAYLVSLAVRRSLRQAGITLKKTD